MEKAEMERNPMAGKEGDNDLTIQSSSAKKVEFSQSVSLTGVESIKRQQSVVTAKDLVIQTILQSQVDMEKVGGKGGMSSGTSTPVRRRSSPAGSLLNEIRKMSLASQDAKEDRQLKRFRRFHGRRRKRREEEYTDKDRAAAVTLGSRDIKQSLRAKKKRERKLCVSADLLNREDFLSDMLLNEATHQMRINDIPMALSTLDKALELHPTHRAALVARSQCFLKLGDAHSALRDAKASCETKGNIMMGLYQYAESLYNLGDFENALIAFHRGFRLRKEMEGFRIGIQKCEEAIEKCIEDRAATRIEDLDEILPIIYEMDNFKNQKTGAQAAYSSALGIDEEIMRGNGKRSSERGSRRISREVLGQMYLDKKYLTKFIIVPELQKNIPTPAAVELRESALEAIEYLQIREEFWRQQNPIYARKPELNLNKKGISTAWQNKSHAKANSRNQSQPHPKRVDEKDTKWKDGEKYELLESDQMQSKVHNPTIKITKLT